MGWAFQAAAFLRARKTAALKRTLGRERTNIERSMSAC